MTDKRTLFALALLLTVGPAAGCDRDSGESSTKVSAPVPEEPQTAKKSQPVEESSAPEASEESAAPEEVPTEEVVRQMEKGEPLEGGEASVERVRRAWSGGAFKFADDSTVEGSDLVAINTWSGGPGGPTNQVVVVDPTSGEHVGPLATPKSRRGSVGWGRKGDWILIGARARFEDLKLVDMQSGESVEPSLQAPPDRSLEDLELRRAQILLPDDGETTVGVIAEHEEERFIGSFGPSDKTVTLAPLPARYKRPYFLDRVGGDYLLKELGPPPAPPTKRGRRPTQREAPTGCAYLTWRPDEGTTCHLEGEMRTPVSGVRYMGAGWGYVSRFFAGESKVIGPDGQQRALSHPECDSPSVLARRLGEPGVLAVCSDDYQAAKKQFIYWSPDRHITFRTSVATDNIRSTSRVEGSAAEPVVAGFWGGMDEPVADWFDLERGVYWKADSLHPLHFGFQRDGRWAMASDVREGESITVYALDFEEGTQRKVATYDDCPGHLRKSEQTGQHAVISCTVQPNPDKFRFRIAWSELVDLKTGRRARLDGFAEHVTSDGTAVVSNRTMNRPGSFRRGTVLDVIRLE